MKSSIFLESRLRLFKSLNCVPIYAICSILIISTICSKSVHATPFKKENIVPDSLSSVIVDESNHPISGATIKVRGTSIVETSDDSGHFSIAPKSINGVKLEISYVGFESKIIDITNGLPSTIALKKKADNNEEVIVIAYGTTNKRNLPVVRLGGQCMF